MNAPAPARQEDEYPVLVHAQAVVCGRGGALEELLAAVRSGQRFEPTRDRCVDTADLAVRAHLSPRESKKVDRFSLLMLAAVSQTLEDHPLRPSEREACGMIVGNMLAGWSFAEPQLRALHTLGAGAVSPYLATAWFPAAAQGHATISLGMRGFAKTLTTDRCSGGQAIGMAFHRLRQGATGSLLAGGVESPTTPFVEAAFSGEGDRVTWLAEAAGLLLLQRGAPESSGARFLGAHASFRFVSRLGLEQRLAAFLDRQRGLPPLLAVVCNAEPWSEAEQHLHTLAARALGEDVPRLSPCRTLGDSLGASSGVAAALACEVLTPPSPPRSVLVLSWGHQCVDLLWIHS